MTILLNNSDNPSRSFLHAVLLFVAVFALYARGLGGPFLYDDIVLVRDNPTLASPLAALKSFGDPSATDAGFFRAEVYRPLIPLIYSLVRFAAGPGPFAFHLLNVLIHALNAVLLYLLMRRLSGRAVVSLAAAAGWALHPINVESVQWISGLDDILVATFLLGMFLLILRGSRMSAWGLYFIALLTKETALAAPAAVFFIEALYAENDESGRWKRALVHTAPYALLAAVFIALRASIIGLTQVANNWGRGPFETLLIMLRAFFRYTQMFLFPNHLRINYWEGFEKGHALPALVGLLLIVLLVALAVYSWRKQPLVTLGVGWLFAFFLPVSNIFPMSSIMAEHFAYIPLMGVFMMALGAAPRRTARAKTARVAWACVLALFALGGFLRIGVWNDEERFWKDIIAKEPKLLSYRVNLANYYAQEKRFPEAEAMYHDVLKRRPQDHIAASNMARMLFDAGRYAESLDLYKQLERAFPADESYAAGAEAARRAMDGRAVP